MTKANIDKRQLDKLKKEIVFFGERTMPMEILKLGFLLNTKIKQRVQNKGQGVNLRTMKYKSASYKRKRAKTNRQTSYKDLTFSGKMWASLTADFFGVGKVRLYFSGREEMVKAANNDKVATFFGISKDEDSFIDKQLSKSFKEARI